MVASNRKPWSFGNAYCSAFRDEYGWNWDGRSDRADTELKRRLQHIMIRHDRKEIWKDTPAKTRQTIRLDVGASDDMTKAAKRLVRETHLFSALERTLELKKVDIVENVMEGLGSGEKAVVWVLSRASVEIMAEAIEKAAGSRAYAPLMREMKLRIWATHGEAPVKMRTDICREYVLHQGAAIIIATMDSLPESVSLFGATTEHYAQLHYMAGPMVQSENRPYLKETSKLHIIYYIAQGTVDERMEALVLPRVETLAALVEESDAMGISSALAKESEESFDDFIKRLTQNMSAESHADFDDTIEESEDE